ncbi:hypothetical protein QTP70_019153, partial [Hemibagrus guttatus]
MYQQNMRSSVCIALVVLVLPAVQTFVPVGSGNTHVTITGNAVMKKIYEVCEAVAESEGRPFKPTGSSAEELLRACLGTNTGQVSGAKFHEALNQIYMQNGLVDRDYASSNPHHFNSEAFTEGHSLISQGVAAVKANIRKNNLQAARETLGKVLHTLQDFYSHSNWVELGYKITYANLIKPDLTIDNVAEVGTPTCSDCASGTCSNPLLPSILKEKKLTSGYMGLNSPNKPNGKCSHGGSADLSSTQSPRGGINKDERLSHNAALHDTAVALAIDATVELLEDVRGAVGNKEYLRMMGIARTAVLCFVIDTTGSMSDDIAEAKRVAHSIIDNKKGTQDEPSEYILVPFNDPSFGPLIRTTNPDIMKREISKLSAVGGGDEPEMCLSGLQLALTGAPASSHIYVFTDATAKDVHLENTIIALIRSTKSTVSVFMTRKRRFARDLGTQGRSGFQVYYNLALASGGQAIEVTKANLPSATGIILDTSTAALVTVLQQARIPGRVENFPFLLDASLSNVTAYLTGNNLKFTLYNPSGVSQPHTVSNGPLAQIQTVGNLQRLHFNVNETGLWRISMESTETYTIKVTGQSATTFIYDFVEEFSGPHSGFAVIEGRPQKGLPVKLLLTISGQNGAEALKLQEVALVEVSDANVVNGTIEEMGGGNFLVTANQVPEGEFVVMMKGEDMTTSSHFQRQTTTQMSQSNVIIKAVVGSSMVPGKEFEVPFTVSTDGIGGVFKISAKNDKDFPLTYNPQLTVNAGGNASGTVKVTPPASTTSGTEVSLTILAEGPRADDSNYAVLRLSVLAEIISRIYGRKLSHCGICEDQKNMRSSVCIALVVLVLPAVQTFVPIGSGNTHVTITANAVMKKIYEVCEAVAESEGRPFKPTGSFAEELLRACLGTNTGQMSGAKFHEALNQIYMENGLVDRDYASSNPHHFNSEAFTEGHSLISQGVAAVKANIRKNNLQAARETLGKVLHTLQDFYSHSNWVELGYKITYANLINPDLTIDNVAEVGTPTCSDCASGTCSNPLLPSILKEKKLTSGYMGLNSPNKPNGKCSHGGSADLSSTQSPRGGINKDDRLSHNAALHDTAVALAIDATVELLEDVRGAVGNKEYLRMMGIARTAVLCFVIDTTGSMSDDIAEAKRMAESIIDTKKGTQDEPSEYILVPFNDPSFGPRIRTTNPDIMKREISKLSAAGGGDEPEMCLSGLQLALTGAPASSHIYVFTDATAKDVHLENTIIALIRSTKSTVTVFMTGSIRFARDLGTQGRSGFQVYYNLALASGGQAIEVTKANLPSATGIILDTSTAALVTVLQRARIPGRVENFPFLLDASLSNVTAYLTGNNLKFTLYNPSGVSQPHTVSNGPLAQIQTVGNLQRLHFNVNETGLWRISMESTETYTIKVTGQSATTFIYDFVEEFSGPHSGFAVIGGRPQKGLPVKLLLTITGQKGAEALKLQGVALVEVSDANVVNGTIEEMGGGKFLVTANQVPEGEFVVMMKGEDMTTSSHFQRQTTTQMSQSKVIINAVVGSSMVPGKESEVPFTVSTDGIGGVFTISAKNDKDFPLTYNPQLTVNAGGNASGTVKVTPPASTTSGTDVTLTILAEGPRADDSNYAVLHLSVLAEVTDFSSPKCQIVSISPICPSDCILSNWDLSVNITDGNGTGIERIYIQKGNGNISYQ